MFAMTLTQAPAFVNFSDLGLDSVAFSVFGWPIRWYALAYLAGIFLGYWYLTRLLRAPGAPMARRHADDMIFDAMMGILIGGRLGYVLFYNPSKYLADPVEILKLWDGGMSLHGGTIGVIVAIWLMARREGLNFWRMCDYVACTIPFGLFLGRLANFVNQELWGRPTDVPWAVIFPASGTLDPRHPSQLYEAGLEGAVMMAVLAFLFWRTDARYKPGFLFGMAAIIYGISRFLVEYVREPDAQLVWLVDASGLSMGQWLTLPMIIAGIWLVVTAKRRRQRVEPIAGPDSIA